MKRTYTAKLCRRGVSGGAIYLDGDTLTYMTRDYFESAHPRALALPISDIEGLSPCRHFLLPAVELNMKSGKKYKFIVYDREVFMNVLNEQMARLSEVRTRREHIA